MRKIHIKEKTWEHKPNPVNQHKSVGRPQTEKTQHKWILL